MENKNTNAPRTGNDAHTPTPWTLMLHGKLTADIRTTADDEVGDLVANCNGHALREMNQANARFIVRACNSHAALVAALEAVTSQADAQFKAGDRHATFNRQTIDSLRAALAAARNT